MTDLYLIAHKVRGEPAFDIAERMSCPECHEGQRWEADGQVECVECDGLGYWWIIPTSGHRAYPYWSVALEELGPYPGSIENATKILPSFWDSLPDHYPHRATPTLDLATALGLTKPRPTQPIKRRM